MKELILIGISGKLRSLVLSMRPQLKGRKTYTSLESDVLGTILTHIKY